MAASSADLPPFTYHSRYAVDKQTDGWHVFSMKAEFERMGVFDTKWRVSTVNKQFAVCFMHGRLKYDYYFLFTF